MLLTSVLQMQSSRTRRTMGLFTLLLLLFSPGAGALDLNTSQHFRAVEVNPSRWTMLFAPRRNVRLFWNGDARYDIQLLTGKGWKTLTRNTASGWTSNRVRRAATFRMTGEDGFVSPPVQAQPVTPPAAIAELAGPRQAILGRSVVDIELDKEGRPWVATLEGGVSWLDPVSGKASTITFEDGLPSNRVISVAPTSWGAWVGTAGGLARVQVNHPPGGHAAGPAADVTVVLGEVDGLADDYVQALTTLGDKLWIGTYRGLSFMQGTELRTILSPWSVFSLVKGADERIWVGYEGLLGLPEAEPIEGVDSGLDVYDIEVLPGTGTLLATLQEGVVLLTEGERIPVWSGRGDDGAYALARLGSNYLAAGANGGLVSIGPSWKVLRTWHPRDGLPSPVVNEVVPGIAKIAASEKTNTTEQGAGAWLGTEAGVAYLDSTKEHIRAYPLSRLPAGTRVTSTCASRHPCLVGESGVLHHRSPLSRGLRSRTGIDEGLLAFFRSGATSWFVYQDRVLQRRPFHRDVIHRIDSDIRAAIISKGVLWLGGEAGAFRFDRRLQQFSRLAST